jgi:hypothetical protein
MRCAADVAWAIEGDGNDCVPLDGGCFANRAS